jgi:hypothetical protein
MPPTNLGNNDWEYLQNTIIRIVNKDVREHFRDVPAEDMNTLSNSERGLAKLSCIHRDSDSALICLLRLWLFYGIVGGMSLFKPPIYGIPAEDFQVQRVYKPQIQLTFQEDWQLVESGYAPIQGIISFRLMKERSETITEAELRSLASKIKAKFGGTTRYKWRKGKKMFSYTDKPNGYQFQLLCISETVAKDLIRDVLSLQGHVPDWKLLNSNVSSEEATRYPTNPGTIGIMGRARKKPRQRPVATVEFVYAICHIHGLPNPIVLYDPLKTYREALVE